MLRLKFNPIVSNTIQFTLEQEQQICDLYISGLDFRKIGIKFSVSTKPIRRILNKNNIKMRTFSEACKGNNQKITKEIKKQICENYINDLNTYEVASKFNIVQSTVRYILKNNNIKIRTNSESKRGRPNIKLQKILTEVEQKIIIDKYNNDLSPNKIAEEFNVSPSYIQRLLRKNEILKTVSESKKGKHCLENNPNWQGGKSFEPYCPKFDKYKKEEIRNKYNRCCIICNKPEHENIIRSGKRKGNVIKLHVHHIDYNKLQGCENHEWRLVPLCTSCHAKTSGKKSRIIWEIKIKEILIIIDNKISYTY